MNAPVITEVIPESLADAAGIRPGDTLVSINGEVIRDVLDYRFFSADPELYLELSAEDGTKKTAVIENEDGADIGLTLCYGDGGKIRRCQNKCIFCFIDQMPKGMRESLYVKDDDVRLSFLTGSYITLTNLSAMDIERILYQRISPVNVSVHTVNPALRRKMLNNKRAGEVYKLQKKLARGGITMNCQVVLVKGVNDKKELSRTIGKLLKLYPYVNSLSVVPVGLTKYREGLPDIQPFGKEDAEAVIGQIEAWQKKAQKKHGVNFVYASDEFYLKAERELPGEEAYDGYPQIENGVGLITSFRAERDRAVETAEVPKAPHRCGIVTGVAAKALMEETAEMLRKKFPGIEATVYAIRNDFFGESVTVSGLVCGKDVLSQLAGERLPEELLFPDVMFRDATDTMLDDVTVGDIEKQLGVKVKKIRTDGASTVRAILGRNE